MKRVSFVFFALCVVALAPIQRAAAQTPNIAFCFPAMRQEELTLAITAEIGAQAIVDACPGSEGVYNESQAEAFAESNAVRAIFWFVDNTNTHSSQLFVLENGSVRHAAFPEPALTLDSRAIAAQVSALLYPEGAPPRATATEQREPAHDSFPTVAEAPERNADTQAHPPTTVSVIGSLGTVRVVDNNELIYGFGVVGAIPIVPYFVGLSGLRFSHAPSIDLSMLYLNLFELCARMRSRYINVHAGARFLMALNWGNSVVAPNGVSMGIGLTLDVGIDLNISSRARITLGLLGDWAWTIVKGTVDPHPTQGYLGFNFDL